MTSDKISSTILPSRIGFIQNLNESSRKNTFWSSATTETYTELSHTTSGATFSIALSDSSGGSQTLFSSNPTEDQDFLDGLWTNELTTECEIDNTQATTPISQYCFYLSFIEEWITVDSDSEIL